MSKKESKDHFARNFVISIVLVITAAICLVFGLVLFCFNSSTMLNERDVVHHMGIPLQTSYQVPNGQTLKFRVNAREGDSNFNDYIQFVEAYKPDTIYFVSAKANAIINYEGCALYFVHDGIIYLYQ